MQIKGGRTVALVVVHVALIAVLVYVPAFHPYLWWIALAFVALALVTLMRIFFLSGRVSKH